MYHDLLSSSLDTHLTILCNHILRLYDINEGYIPYGRGNKTPFILTIYTNSDKVNKVLIKYKNKIRKEINKAMKKCFKREMRSAIEMVKKYQSLNYNIYVRYASWKIRNIEVNMIDYNDKVTIGEYNLLNKQTTSLGYYFEGYDIPWK